MGFNPNELRDFHGRWTHGGGHHHGHENKKHRDLTGVRVRTRNGWVGVVTKDTGDANVLFMKDGRGNYGGWVPRDSLTVLDDEAQGKKQAVKDLSAAITEAKGKRRR